MRQPPANEVISVSELNRQARFLLEAGLQQVWLEAEISNLATPASGHIYFSLKDKTAQVRCAMFRGANRQLRFKPENGMAVLVHAKVSIYEARGEYQLVADHMEEAGEGQLRRQFEELKARLGAEGLFAEEHKQPLPEIPGNIGIVTSPSGAAIRDILHILKRRFPSVPVTIFPTAVQGDAAIKQIAKAIAAADERSDVIILARGGGSLEDLWAFNEEIVARAIYAARSPVISGVGHETDFTIADLVADVRAPTPSGAAEIAVPDRDDWLRHLQHLNARTARSVARMLEHIKLRAGQSEHRLNRCSPHAVLQQRSQLLDELNRRSSQALNETIRYKSNQINILLDKLNKLSPEKRLAQNQQRLDINAVRLEAGVQQLLKQRKHQLAIHAAKLHTVSPLATLDRGYAIVSDTESKTLIADMRQVAIGQQLTTRLANGEITSEVTAVSEQDKNNAG